MSNLEKLNDWKAAHPDRVKLNDRRRLKKWRENNPEKSKEQWDRSNKARRERNYYKENKEYLKDRYLKRKYGITLEYYNQLLLEQNNTCAICGVSACPSGKSFAVDHDSITGEVRGLLCKNCNIGLGFFFHNIEFLKNALGYLL